MIKWWGRLDNGTGILRNQTDGGQGGAYWTGKKRTPYARKKKDRIKIFGICEVCGSNFHREYTNGDKRLQQTMNLCSPSCRNKQIATERKSIRISCISCRSEMGVGFFYHKKYCNNFTNLIDNNK